MDRYLVTGGAGFIGSHIVGALGALGAGIAVLDDLSSGCRENLEASGATVDLVVGDVRDPEAVARAAEGADCVIHLAALTSIPESVRDPLRFNEVNVAGTLRVLEGARRAGAQRFLLASSCSVYGEPGAGPTGESSPPSPLSPYAASKLASEGYCQAYRHSGGIEASALRLFNVYGPRQTADSPYAAVIPKFLSALTRGERPVIFGDGGQTRDFVFVEDVASAFLAVAGATPSPWSVYNVGTGRALQVLEILREAGRALGVETDPEFRPARAGDIRHSLADVSRLRDATGFEAATEFGEGMARTARWLGSIEGRNGDG